MKKILRKAFKPILDIFESGDEEIAYKPLNRKILLVVGTLFILLGSAIVAVMPSFNIGMALPLIVFFGVGSVCWIVGGLGTDRAVSKIWGSKK